MKNLCIIFGILFIFITIAFQSCDDSDEVYMWVAAEKVILLDDHAGVERPFYQYKLRESDSWESLYPLIVGFDDYEEGYEYLLLVKIGKIKKPAEDQYPKTYTFLKIISKTKKEV